MKTHSSKNNLSVKLLTTLLLFSSLVTSATAASVDVLLDQSTSGAEGSTSVNLTTEGSLDWGVWANAGTLIPSDSMSGGTGFSSLSLLPGATQNTAAFGNPENSYSWTNGTSVVSEAGVTNAARAIFTDIGGGVRLTVNVDGAGSYQLKFHTSTANAITISGSATLLTAGASDTVAGTAQAGLVQSEFTVNFTTDGADTLTLDIMKVEGSSNIFAYEAFTLKPYLPEANLLVDSSYSYNKGGTDPQSLQLSFKNDGSSDLSINAVTSGGPDGSDFTIGTFTSLVAPGEEGLIDFTFTPSDGNRTYNATFTIDSSDPDSPSTVVNVSALSSESTMKVTIVESISSGTFTTPIDLTAEGTLDWGIWQDSQRTLTNRKDGGSAFNNLELLENAADTAAVFPNPENIYSWTDGTSPVAGDSNGGAHARAAFTNVGDGLSMSIDVPSAGLYQLKFHASTSNTISLGATASLSSGASDTIVGSLNTALSKSEFVINFTTESADTLTLEIFKSAGTSNIFAFEAFTFRAIPMEPELQVAPTASYSTVSSSQSFQLPFSNSGGVNLNILGVAIGGADAPYFKIDSITSPVTPGNSAGLGFTFTPTDGLRAYNATFNILSNDPNSPSTAVNITAVYTVGLGNVICIGDSITEARASRPLGDGNWSWRYAFWQQLVDSNTSHQFVGTRTANNGGSSIYPDYSGLSFTNRHEAIWGTTALERSNSASAYLGALKAQGQTPDTAIVYCGTNDASSASASTIRDWVKSIVDQLQGDVGTAGNQNVRILLVSIIPRFTGAPDYTTPAANNTSIYPAANALMKQLAIDETTATSKVSFLDIFPLFSSNSPMILWDGTHPNGAGERIEAANIFAALIPNSDGDELADTWEELYFGNNNTADPSGDPDGDGRDNLNEFVFGTNPNSPESNNLLTFSQDRSLVSFTLPAATGAGYEGVLRKYELESSTDLTNWNIEQSGIADGENVSVPVSPDSLLPRFYRLSVTLD